MTNSAEIINFPEQTIEQGHEYVKADTDNGYYRVANELGLALCKTHLNDSEGRLLQAIMLKTFGWNKPMDWICYEQLSELTGISITNIGKIKTRLVNRRILIVDGKKTGVNPIVSEWQNKSKQTQNTENKKSSTRLTNKSKQTHGKVYLDSPASLTGMIQKKDTITKDTITKDTNGKSLKIPPEIIKDLFNEKLPALSKVLLLNANRKNLIKARQRDLPTIEHWESYFEKINASDFLTGKSSNWKASFDWIIKDSNCLKILEGNYDNPAVNATSKVNNRSTVSEHNQQAMEQWLANNQQSEIEVNPNGQ